MNLSKSLFVACVAMFSQASVAQTHNVPNEVDLGLSVKWSDSYLDSEMVYLGNSGYFWASTTARKNYVEPNEEIPYNVNVGMSIAGTNYDCVTAALGNGWRMPTKAECEELAKLEVKYGVIDGRKGYTVTAPNGNSIFLECQGMSSSEGMYTQFWTADAYRESSESTDYTRAWACRITLVNKIELIDETRQDEWLWIRPVRDIKPESERIAVTDIMLSATELTLPIGCEERLIAEVMPLNAYDRKFTFTSSDPDVVSVGATSGMAKAIASGSATITATATDGSGVSATCTVTVPSLEDNNTVDLGLSVLWATYNVGAENMKQTGTFYQFANPAIVEKWSVTTSPYVSTRTIPVKNMAGTDYDPAKKVMGSEWMTPTKEQFQELFDNCDKIDTEDGFELTSRINGAKIYFPFTGWMYVLAQNDPTYGYYMTAEISDTGLTTGKVTCAKLYKNTQPSFDSTKSASQGIVIRAVKNKPQDGIENITAEDIDGTADVYSLAGVKVLSGASLSEINSLAPGMYIIRTASGKAFKICL